MDGTMQCGRAICQQLFVEDDGKWNILCPWVCFALECKWCKWMPFTCRESNLHDENYCFVWCNSSSWKSLLRFQLYFQCDLYSFTFLFFSSLLAGVKVSSCLCVLCVMLLPKVAAMIPIERDAESQPWSLFKSVFKVLWATVANVAVACLLSTVTWPRFSNLQALLNSLYVQTNIIVLSIDV